MVFGWGKKKTERIEEPEQSVTPQKKEITLSEINPILDDIRNLRKKTVVSQTKNSKNGIKAHVDAILKLNRDLENDDLKLDDVDIHLKVLVVRGKKLVISTIKKEAGFSIPEIESYDDVLRLNSNLSQMLKRIGDVLGRQTRVIHIFAQKYAAKLKVRLSEIKSYNDEIEHVLSNYKKMESNASQITSLLEKHASSLQTIDDNRKKIDEIHNKNKTLESQIDNIQSEIDALEKSDEYAKFLEIQQSIKSLDAEKSGIKSQIDDEFSQISRPLNKYVYVSSLEKQQKILMQKLVDSPYDVLIPSNKSDIVTILESVKKAVNSGSVSVKNTEKSLEQINSVMGSLDTLMSKTGEFSTKKEKLVSQLDVFDAKALEQKKSQLTKTKDDIQSNLRRTEELDKETSSINDDLPKIITEIEINLHSATATKYHIKN